VNALNDILKLKSAEAAGLATESRSYNTRMDENVRNRSAEQINSSPERHSHRTEVTPQADEPADPLAKGLPSSGAREHDMDALLLQLESLGLRLFVDDTGRHGRQFPAGEFGRIDLLATDSNGNFVVIDFKGEESPCATIGQMAGYMAFVKKNLAKTGGHSVNGWILARPSFSSDDGVLEEAAEAVGLMVKWYWVRLEFLENRSA